MIFPGDFKELNLKKPEWRLSWAVLILNITLFIVTAIVYDSWPVRDSLQILNDEKFKHSVAEMYVQTLDPIELKNLKGSSDQIYFSALKDERFWKRVETYPFIGDQIQIAENREVISGFYKSYLNSVQYQFGLSSFELSPWSWVTYQFIHGSFMHLLGNMFVIFMLLRYLEKRISETWLMTVYLFSGFAGGVAFLLVDKTGGMAVVGASAAASGLMSFLLATYGNRLMPWGYLIAPVKNGYGQIYLPVFFIFPVFLISDFVTLLWEPTGVAANVAVSAHVGGALMGFALGAIYLFLWSKTASHRVLSYNDGLHELS